MFFCFSYEAVYIRFVYSDNMMIEVLCVSLNQLQIPLRTRHTISLTHRGTYTSYIYFNYKYWCKIFCLRDAYSTKQPSVVCICSYVVACWIFGTIFLFTFAHWIVYRFELSGNINIMNELEYPSQIQKNKKRHYLKCNLNKHSRYYSYLIAKHNPTFQFGSHN